MGSMAVAQFVAMAKTRDYTRMDFVCEVGTGKCASSCLQVIRNRSHRYALVAVEQQQGSNRLGSIIVQQVMPPVALDQFGNQHCDIAVWMKNLLLDRIVDNRLHDESIRRIEHYQFG